MGVSHAATSHVALRKVEAASSFSATWNPIFRCETSCKLWCVTRGSLVLVTRGSLATYNGTAFAWQLARKIASCDMALSRRFLPLKPR